MICVSAAFTQHMTNRACRPCWDVFVLFHSIFAAGCPSSSAPNADSGAGAPDHPLLWGQTRRVSWFPPEAINHAGVALELRSDSLAVLLFSLNLAVIWT